MCLRFDQNDPCKAARQLTRQFKKWSANYNFNENRERDLATRIQAGFEMKSDPTLSISDQITL